MSAATTSEALVCVVDDDEAVRDSLAIMLESEGLAVEVYASGRAFLTVLGSESAEDTSPAGRVAAESPPRRLQCGCVIADVRMPDMDGLELLEHLQARAPDLPVIIITGHGDVPMAVRAMKAGAADFIEKPFAPEVLLGVVQRVLASAGPSHGPDTPASEALARLALLTPREAEVLEQLVIGRPNKLIAHELGISPRTVEIHRARVMEKMGARSLSHLVRLALAAGIGPRVP